MHIVQTLLPWPTRQRVEANHGVDAIVQGMIGPHYRISLGFYCIDHRNPNRLVQLDCLGSNFDYEAGVEIGGILSQL